jgi:hydroxymethylglutaryl-CoA lyase
MINLPSKVILTEVGLRDGFQNLPGIIPTSMKIDILSRLIDAGIKRIQICSFVSSVIVPQMADAKQLCQALPTLREPQITFSALALNIQGVEQAYDCGLDQVDVSISADPVHSKKNTGMELDRARKSMKKMIQRARQYKMKVFAGIQCAFGSPFNNSIPDERIYDMTCEILQEQVDAFGLFDTSGMATPSRIKRLLDMLLPRTKSLPFFFHFHDTKGFGDVNLIIAMDYGINWFDTSFGGLGGCPFIPDARGNIATEHIALLLNDLGIETGIDIDSVHSCYETVANYLGKHRHRL